MEKKKIGKWEFNIGPSKVLSAEILRELEEFLNNRWLGAVLKNVSRPWWSIKNRYVPSPIIRVDMAPSENPENIISSLYEVEIRPAGLGIILSLLSQNEREEWKRVFKEFGCQGFIHLDSSVPDDSVAAELLGFPYFEKIPKENKGPYWIRSEHLGEGHEELSLTPLQGDENKSYLVELGLAKVLSRAEDIDWKFPFVVKPLIGSKMRGVEIYLPPKNVREWGNPKGTSTRSRVRRSINGGEPYLIQPFIPSAKEEINGIKGWTIWRIFFGWKEGYRFLAGLWNWRPNLRVHGSKDAVFGLLIRAK